MTAAGLLNYLIPLGALVPFAGAVLVAAWGVIVVRRKQRQRRISKLMKAIRNKPAKPNLKLMQAYRDYKAWLAAQNKSEDAK